MEKKKPIAYYDALNVLACFCVIAMHCNGVVHSFEHSSVWYSALLIEVLCFWAVPVFFMLSGATLMNYRERYSTKDFLKRRLQRIGIPLLFWSAFFLLLKWLKHDMPVGTRAFCNMLINFEIEPVYWFFAPLLMVYFAMPILSLLSQNKKVLWYMLSLGIATYSVFPLLFKLMGLSYNSNFYFPLTGGYILYVLLGYLLSTTDLKPWQRILCYILAIGGAAFRYSHTLLRFELDGVKDTLTWGDKFLPTLCLAVGVFVFAKYLFLKKPFQNEKLAKVLHWLSGASFGIYLIHIFVMKILRALLRIPTASTLWRLLGPIAMYLVCLAIVQIGKKIPLGKYLFP